MLGPHVYTTRRRGIQSRVRSEIIIFFGDDDCPINFADNVYSFRQDGESGQERTPSE